MINGVFKCAGDDLIFEANQYEYGLFINFIRDLSNFKAKPKKQLTLTPEPFAGSVTSLTAAQIN